MGGGPQETLIFDKRFHFSYLITNLPKRPLYCHSHPPSDSQSANMSSTGGISEDAGLNAARKYVIPNTVKIKLDKGELAHSFSIKLISNIEIVHYAAAAGYDAILIDLEHSSMGLEATNQLSCAALQVGYVFP